MNYRDEFDEPPRGNGLSFLGSVGPKAAFFVVLIALSFMIGVVWNLYVGGGTPKGQDVPIVRADDNPFKVEPVDPGGMEVPHKESTIFSSLNNDQDKRVENLLADEDDEEPMPRSQLFAGLNTEQAPELSAETQETPLDKPLRSKINAENKQEHLVEVTEEVKEIKEVPKVPKVVEDVIDTSAEAVTPTPEKVEPVVTPKVKVAPKVRTIQEIEVKPEVKPKIKPTVKAKPKAVAVPSATSSGDYYVQLGSVKTSDGAEGEWKKIVAKYPSILSGFNHRVEVANLGEKGTFYRIQAGPISKDRAVSACKSIKKINPNGCLLKKK
jgi:cell division protein FtsN